MLCLLKSASWVAPLLRSAASITDFSSRISQNLNLQTDSSTERCPRCSLTDHFPSGLRLQTSSKFRLIVSWSRRGAPAILSTIDLKDAGLVVNSNLRSNHLTCCIVFVISFLKGTFHLDIGAGINSLFHRPLNKSQFSIQGNCLFL